MMVKICKNWVWVFFFFFRFFINIKMKIYFVDFWGGFENSLNNNFFVSLLEVNTDLVPNGINSFELTDGETKKHFSRVDLMFASNSELRAIAEVYASDENREKFVTDFISAWTKVMNLDRFDLN